jgi:MFS transporter, DHA1 family, inner membrane transport protein
MGIFKNRSFIRVYVHTALQGFAAHGGESFVFVYLLKAGIAVPLVLLSIAAMFGSRFMFRSAVLPLVRHIGLRQSLIVGILLEAATYPLLSFVDSTGPLLWFYLLCVAISSSFYWTTFHAYVSLLGDQEHRGAQTSGMEFTGALVGIFAPAVSGLLLAYAGPKVAFSLVGLVLACAALPFINAPEVHIAHDAVIPKESRRLARLAMITDGIRSGSFHFTWLIAMFITLKQSFAAYGGALALAGLAGAVMGLFLGKTIDVGNGKRALQVGFLALACAVLFRAFGYSDVWSAVLANAFAAAIWPVYIIAFNSRIYDLARQSACPLRYHVIAEGGWDLGVGTSCLVAAGLVAMGFGFFWPLMQTLVACFAGYMVLASTYSKA